VAAWINTEDYKLKNFARQALVVNPAHACQPLGAELCAHGFAETLPLVHGSQGCASYYRSTLNRHFSRASASGVFRHERRRRGIRRTEQPARGAGECRCTVQAQDDRSLHIVHAGKSSATT